jgi:hypothetical protein
MQNTFLLVFTFLCLSGSIWFTTKIIDWIRVNKKPLDEKSEFNLDLFRLSQKWIAKGQYNYSKSIQAMIEYYNEPKEEEPTTEYGKRVKRDAIKALEDAYLEKITDLKDESYF